MLASSLTADLKINDMHYSRFGLLFTYEKSSTWASLMAGELFLGPSDAPCPVETSTAHDDSFFRAMVLPYKQCLISWISASATYHTYSLLPPKPLSPEMPKSLQISSSSPASRRALILAWSTKTKLGFRLAGLVSNIGPLTLTKSKPNISKPRSVSTLISLVLSQCLCRLYTLTGRRLQLRVKSPSLLWSYNHLLRTLVLASSMVMNVESKSLKIYCLLFLNPNCRRLDCGHGRPNYHSMTTLSSDFKHRINTIISKTWIMFYKANSECHKSDLEPLFCVLKHYFIRL